LFTVQCSIVIWMLRPLPEGEGLPSDKFLYLATNPEHRYRATSEVSNHPRLCAYLPTSQVLPENRPRSICPDPIQIQQSIPATAFGLEAGCRRRSVCIARERQRKVRACPEELRRLR